MIFFLSGTHVYGTILPEAMYHSIDTLESLLLAEDFEKVVIESKRTLSTQGIHSKVFGIMGIAEFKLGRYSDAATGLYNAISLSSTQGRTDEFEQHYIAIYNKIISLFRKDLNDVEIKGDINYRSNNFPLALEYYMQKESDSIAEAKLLAYKTAWAAYKCQDFKKVFKALKDFEGSPGEYPQNYYYPPIWNLEIVKMLNDFSEICPQSQKSRIKELIMIKLGCIMENKYWDDDERPMIVLLADKISRYSDSEEDWIKIVSEDIAFTDKEAIILDVKCSKRPIKDNYIIKISPINQMGGPPEYLWSEIACKYSDPPRPIQINLGNSLIVVTAEMGKNSHTILVFDSLNIHRRKPRCPEVIIKEPKMSRTGIISDHQLLNVKVKITQIKEQDSVYYLLNDKQDKIRGERMNTGYAADRFDLYDDLTLSLKPGNNLLQFKVVDEYDDRTVLAPSSAQFTITYNPEKLYKKTLCLLIGIDEYGSDDQDPTIRPLLYPVSDVQGLEKVLRENILCDTIITLINHQANYTGIQKILDWISQSVAPKDAVFIYWSGHGIKNDDGAVELLPWNGVQSNEYSGRNFQLEEIRDWYLNLSCSSGLFLLNSCYSGKIIERFFPFDVNADCENNFAENNENIIDGKFVWASCASNEVAREVPGNTMKHSLWGDLFINALSGYDKYRDADNNMDGFLTMSEVFIHLDKNLQITKNRNSISKPLYPEKPLKYRKGVYPEEGDFTFIRLSD